MTTGSGKLRALVLATIMVMSVVAPFVAFAGATTAQGNTTTTSTTTPTTTATETPTQTPTSTPTETATPTPAQSPTPTSSPTPTATSKSTPTETTTPEPTATPSATPTPTATPTDGAIVVDDDGGEDYTSVQNAIDNASSGDTIQVNNGTYTESLTLSTSNLTIVGESESGTVIDGGLKVDSAVDGLTIESLTMEGDRGSSRTLYATSTVTNLTVDSVTFDGTDSVGFAIYGNDFAGDVSVAGSTFTGYTDSSQWGTVYVSTKTGLDDVTFTGNDVTDNAGKVEFHGNEGTSGSKIGSLTVTDNTFSGTSAAGAKAALVAQDAASSTIENNDFSDNFAHVQHIDADVTTDTLVSANTFDRAASVDGVGVFSSIQAAVDAADSGDTIEVSAGTYDESVTIDKDGVTLIGAGVNESVISPDSGIGLLVDGRTGNSGLGSGGSLDNVTIEGFSVDAADGFGVVAYSETASDDYDTTNLTVRNVKVDGTDAFGVGLMSSTGATIDNVTVANVSDSSIGALELVGVKNLDVADSTITDNAVGLKVKSAPNYGANTDVAVTNTTFAGNDVAVQNNASLTIDATYNYWGAPSGPSGDYDGYGSSVSKNVSVEPFYTGANLTTLSTESTPTGIVVDDDGPSDFDSIQAAVNAASDGDRVNVKPGTYNETVTVNTANVTLVGPNAGTPGNDDRSAEATINGQLIVEADDVTVDGFDVSPPDATDNKNAEALRVSGNADDVVIQNNVVRDFGEDGLAQWRGVDAINVFGGSESDAVENVTITDNLVDGISGRDTDGGTTGVSIQGNIVNATVQDNTITNVGQEATAWAFGITVRGTENHETVPTNVEVVDNNVSNVLSNPSTSTSGVGIGLESGSASDVTFTENEISNAEFLLEDKTATVDLRQFTAHNTVDRGALLAGAEFNEKDPRNVIFGSIQPAIDAAESGDTIEVTAGTYDEQILIDTSNVTLTAVGDATIRGTSADDVSGTGGIGFESGYPNNVTISGFTITDAQWGIGANNAGDNLTIAGNTFVDVTTAVAHGGKSGGQAYVKSDWLLVDNNVSDSQLGYRLWGLSNTAVVNNDFEELSGSAVSLIGTNETVVNRNEFSNITKSGVYIDAAFGNVNDVPIENIAVENNTFDSAGERGMEYLHAAVKTGQGVGSLNAVTVQRNAFLNTTAPAIYTDEGDSTTGSIDATLNWWGAPSGPSGDFGGHGVAVKGSVTVEPFYLGPGLSSTGTFDSVRVSNASIDQNNTATVELSGGNTSSVNVTLPESSTASSVTVTEADAPTGNATDIGEGRNVATYLDIDAGEDIDEDVTISTTVSKSSLDAKNIQPGQAVILHFTDGEWVELETTANVTGGQVTLTATASGLSPFAVGQTGSTNFTNSVTIPADGEFHSVAFPAPVDGTVSEVFGDVDGVVYAYDGSSWQTGADIASENVDALDAFVVKLNSSESDLDVEFQYRDDDSVVQSMATADLDAGWNFVGAPQASGWEDAFAATTGGTVERVVNSIGAPENVPYGLSGSTELVGPSTVSPYQGYWVFVTADGTLAATVPVDPTPTQEENALDQTGQ